MIDTGFIPKIIPYQISQSVPMGVNSKLITLTFPVIERSTERYRPAFIQLGDKVANPELVANLDAMARKNLRDEMPGYVLRATSRALVSLAAQYAADQAAQQAANRRGQNNQNGSAALIGAIAGMITGYGLQAINVTDVRHWSTLPAQTYMARMGLPIGQTVLRYTLPSGVTASQTVNLVGGYNVVYIRMFRNRATVLTSNDPATLPPKAPASIPPVATTPVVVASPPKVEPAPISNPASSSASNSKPEFNPNLNPNPNSEPNIPPASSNMEGVRSYEPPNLLNSLQQLFN